MIESIWNLERGDSPLAAAAIHDGHAVRDDIAAQLQLSDGERLYEEDPFTGEWTAVAPTRLIGLRSRFEVDLNRPRDTAVYQSPEDAWGLRVWKAERLSALSVERSLAEYDAFYGESRRLFADLAHRHGRFLVLDLHSYNHRREGPEGPPADRSANPEVNLGTGTMSPWQRERWAPLIDRFVGALRQFDFLGRRLDVRENVKFQGGHFSRWIHRTFPDSGCALAIEFKKFFMDEWTGKPDRAQLDAIGQALASTVPGLLQGLREDSGRSAP